MTELDWKCIACRAKNASAVDTCEKCGVARPAARARRSEAKPGVCRIDGGAVDAKGFCAVGQAYVSTAACPFACPFCRGRLTWSGHCFACFGCSTAKREDWTIPGDRYDTNGGHYVLVEKGPRVAGTSAQNREALQVVMAVASGELTEAAGHDMLALLGVTR